MYKEVRRKENEKRCEEINTSAIKIKVGDEMIPLGSVVVS